jgi:hypothetical protein
MAKSEKCDLGEITRKLEMYRDVEKEDRKELADANSRLTCDRDKR